MILPAALCQSGGIIQSCIAIVVHIVGESYRHMWRLSGGVAIGCDSPGEAPQSDVRYDSSDQCCGDTSRCRPVCDQSRQAGCACIVSIAVTVSDDHETVCESARSLLELGRGVWQ